ncbi:phosphodiester glycosidase family protein [Echinicola sp. CAU 1574]|uniref:Phosphodiester glycosidase family protein n=1 Tax=Echinicola arenosa TaxID=2774144 RepID=A0ABR9AMR6_9BACT|nr:phosphodiester glycosidase family protein [Echinicola arenosa]MBD8489153.1 phosphodiester glycosidase family protein [Echinicola arenosa]
MTKNIKYYYSLFLLTVLTMTTVSCENEDVQPSIIEEEISSITQRLMDSTGLVSNVFWDTTFVVAPGVEETDIHYLSMKGLSMRMFVFKIDLKENGVELNAMMPYGSKGYGMQSIPAMLEYVEVPGKKVVGAVNSDFFNMTTGEPRGIVVLDGEVIKNTAMLDSFFGIYKNGKPVIGLSDDFEQYEADLQFGLGAGDLLVRDYDLAPLSNPEIHPRTGVGFTDLDEVYFIVVDGRDFDYSNGLTLSELAEMFKALGVKDATNLDGGGSSTFVTLHSLSDVFHIRNKPSDGSPRPVGNGWAILVNEN